MSDKLRPRFRYYVPSTQSMVQQKFKKELQNPSNNFTGSSLEYHISVDYSEKVRHFWTPQMDLNLEKYDEGTLIRGLIGPRANVWTVFMFFYAVAGVAGLAGVIIGTGQWSMGESPIAFWLLPVSLGIFLAVYLIGRTGKKIAYEESVSLHKFLMENLDNPIELELTKL